MPRIAIPYGQMQYPKKWKHLKFYQMGSQYFRQKARLVAGGHMTKAPATVTYFNIVSRKAVRIVLMIATLNDLEVK